MNKNLFTEAIAKFLLGVVLVGVLIFCLPALCTFLAAGC